MAPLMKETEYAMRTICRELNLGKFIRMRGMAGGTSEVLALVFLRALSEYTGGPPPPAVNNYILESEDT